VCRVLICDRRRLLSFIGLFRQRPFAAAERCVLSALVAPLHDRLIDERLRVWSRASAGSIAALLEAFPTAAFLVRDGGIVEDANAAGIEELTRDAALPATLAAAVAGAPPGQLRVHRLSERRDRGGLALVLRSGNATDARALALAASWSLTPRQRQVATLLARGMTNKEIAVELGCSVRGVEHHLTQLLARSGCRGRTEFVARFWSAGPTAY
jgi:DNA-binding CsgD family transcriptional regulator